MPLKKGVNKNCTCCGKEFYVPSYRAISAKFCSTFCLNKGQYENHRKNCQRCNKLFMVSNSRLKKKFCSTECKAFAKYDLRERRRRCKRSAIISRGKFTGRTLRKYVFDNKPKICQICDYNEFDFCLDIHHIDENSHNNSLKNLAVLCCMCHKKLHKGVLNASQIREIKTNGE